MHDDKTHLHYSLIIPLMKAGSSHSVFLRIVLKKIKPRFCVCVCEYVCLIDLSIYTSVCFVLLSLQKFAEVLLVIFYITTCIQLFLRATVIWRCRGSSGSFLSVIKLMFCISRKMHLHLLIGHKRRYLLSCPGTCEGKVEAESNSLLQEFNACNYFK